jgi:hypothetical protein
MRTHRPFAITLAATALALLAGCAQPAPAPPGQPSPTGATGTESAAPPPSAPDGALAVYYLGTERLHGEDGRQVERIKLYREFHRIPGGDGSQQARTLAAIAEMLKAGTAYDPDYRTGWPAGARVNQVRIDGDTVIVDLHGVAKNNVGAEAANQAVQQLIWTATAVSGKSVVRLLVDSTPAVELWGHVTVGGDLRRGRALDVLALVWLIDPQHGAVVGQTFTIHVSGSVHEGTVQLRARQGDRTVKEQFVTAGGMDQFNEAKTTMTLPAGTYVLEAYSQSMADGRPMFLDNHTITVR